MQLSETFRQGIVLSQSRLADIRLSTGQFSEDNLADYFVIDVGPIFDIVWASGLLAKINKCCDVDIDDYAEVSVSPAQLPKIIEILDKHYMKQTYSYLFEFYQRLKFLCQEGIRNNLPLHFVL